MAGTNPEPVIDDDKPVTEDDLRALKYPDEGVESPKETVEPTKGEETEEESPEPATEEEQIPEAATEEEAEAPTTDFVKEFPNIKGDTPEEYAKNLEAAYKNSTAEFQRLRDEQTPAPSVTSPAEPPADPAEPKTQKSLGDLFAEQQLDRDIKTAYAAIQKDYPQVNDPTDYTKFTDEVRIFSDAATAKGVLPEPADLYHKAVISLGWQKQSEPDDKEKLAIAAKNGAAASGAASPAKPKPAGPKVSEEQLKLNRKMYPGKTDAEIIEELTPYLP